MDIENLKTTRKQLELDLEQAEEEVRLWTDIVTALPDSTPAHVLRYYNAKIRFLYATVEYETSCLELFDSAHPEVKEATTHDKT